MVTFVGITSMHAWFFVSPLVRLVPRTAKVAIAMTFTDHGKHPHYNHNGSH